MTDDKDAALAGRLRDLAHAAEHWCGIDPWKATPTFYANVTEALRAAADALARGAAAQIRANAALDALRVDVASEANVKAAAARRMNVMFDALRPVADGRDVTPSVRAAARYAISEAAWNGPLRAELSDAEVARLGAALEESARKMDERFAERPPPPRDGDDPMLKRITI